MSRLDSNATIKGMRNTDTDKSARRTKAGAALTILALTGLLTMSYMNDNVFMEHIAICSFIVSCVAIVKLMGSN
ncbi:hypothetical protein [Winogradskyella flava]|uniref:Uncharacterized protein n=1 Tax=Winogradskyella flava TaxID=1884876 RepID=A0A842IPG6_9FLAO|nr:hypothetical protein [Winogradskyella flava]MBC2844890.1 hypothetical protein [Winogradskyella flava]